jgi:hypothetical protein
MRARESAESGNGLGLRSTRRRRSGGGVVPTPADREQAAARAGRLGYIADMSQQLEMMSANMGCQTLAALLELARKEALVQRQAGRKPASGGI